MAHSFPNIRFPAPRDSTLHYGLWNGIAHARLGHSRNHQRSILTTSGGEIFTTESHDDLTIGTRVTYRVGFDALGIEALAVDVHPVEPVAARKVQEPAIEAQQSSNTKRIAK